MRRCLFLLLALVCATDAAAQATLLFEDFTNGLPQSWSIVGQQARVTNGTLFLYPPSWTTFAAVQLPNTYSYGLQCEFDVTVLYPDDNVVLRYTTPTRTLDIYVSGATAFEPTGMSKNDFAQVTSTQRIPTGTYTHVTVVFTSSGNITLSLNGAQVLSYQDIALVNGTLQLLGESSPSGTANNEGVAIDNVRVTQLGTSPLSASITGQPLSGTVPFSSSFTATANGESQPYTYQWSTGETGPAIVHQWTTSGTYTESCTVTDATGAKATSNTLQITASTIGGGAFYHFDEGSGTTATDSSGAGNNGTITGATYVTGQSGTALHFGSSAYVLVPRSAFTGFANTAYFEAWIKPSSYTASDRETIFRKRGDSNDWEVVLGHDGSLYTGLSPAGVISAPGIVPLNTWSKVASWYDGSSLRIYLNDVQVAHVDQVFTPDWNGDYKGTEIGNNSDTNATYFFPGDIDEVRISTTKTVTTPTCTLGCTPTVPSSETTTSPISFAASATPSGSCATPTYAWTFGDGGTSTQQNPQHTYANAGQYPWTLTVTSGTTTCQRNGTVTVSAPCAITITVPNGGETWPQNSLQNIRWNRTGACGSTMALDVLRSNSFFTRITAAGDETTGFFNHTIPTSYPAGNDYKIRITDNGTSATDTSDAPFTIQGQTPVATFSADPVTIVAGRSTTLQWTTTNATNVSIDNSIGNVALNGSRSVSPTTTTSYTLTATGGGGTTNATQTVSVVPTPAATYPPVLYAHGICSDANAWNTMIPLLQGLNPPRYGTTGSRENLYYDGAYVRDHDDPARTYPPNPNYPGSSLGSLRKVQNYTITYYDPNTFAFTGGSDTTAAQLPISELAGQLQLVIEAIRNATGAPQVDLVAHSMGGLVSRAYIENLASMNGQSVGYRNDVKRLVTIDTPHNGAGSWLVVPGFCISSDTEQRREMVPNSTFLGATTPSDKSLNGRAIPPNVYVTSIASRTVTQASDGVVTTASQDLTALTTYRCAANIDAIPNTVEHPYVGAPLHLTVIDLPATAAWVDSRLGLAASTREGCKPIGSGNVWSLTIPSFFTAGPVTAMLNFGGSTINPTAKPTATCTATVTARSDGGAVLAQQTVPAQDYQTVSLGNLPADGWHVEIVPTCDVIVDIAVGVGVPLTTRHRAVAPR